MLKDHAAATSDWPTVIAIAAIVAVLTVGLHEGAHAVTCMLFSDLEEFSALHVGCDDSQLTVAQGKWVSASAAIYNVIVGTICWWLLKQERSRASATTFFLWLFMLSNWAYGCGYLMFSGIANIGDYANVIRGWEPHWLWRVLMTLVGSLIFLLIVWLSIRMLGQIIGGHDEKEQVRRAVRLCAVAYVSFALVIAFAGLFNPYGLLSVPVTAGLTAALGALSPLLWLPHWFSAKSFEKVSGTPLVVQRHLSWIIIAVVSVLFYGIVLGQTLYF